MKVLAAVALVCTILPLSTHSQGVPMNIFGIGTRSCATWLSTPAKENEGEIWIYGAWSGINFKNSENHTVGNTTDSNGIVAEVIEVCRREPSMSLSSATFQAYIRLERISR